MMDTHTAWTLRKNEQATRSATACAQAARDVGERIFTSFDEVTLLEFSEQVDQGVLRLEPRRIVFAGTNVTRVVPYGSIVLMGSVNLSVTSAQHCCYVNSTAYPTAMTFLYGYPLEFHLGAWYHRWLESTPFTETDPFTEVEPSDILAGPPSHR